MGTTTRRFFFVRSRCAVRVSFTLKGAPRRVSLIFFGVIPTPRVCSQPALHLLHFSLCLFTSSFLVRFLRFHSCTKYSFPNECVLRLLIVMRRGKY